jgi:SAM-dependent methyltransferase
MDWRYKALVQRVLSVAPGGHRANYFLQRRVTRKLPSSDAAFRRRVTLAGKHLSALRRHRAADLTRAVFFEFGAGWNLTVPLAFFAAGVERQVLVDIASLVKPDLVNHTIRQFQRITTGVDAGMAPTAPLPSGRQFVPALASAYGIEYRAPCDARRTGLASASVDCVTSTFTLEHIPEADIAAILRECTRILRPGGLVSFMTDYQDHYSYFDRSITRYNYLRFSDREWRRFNPPLHYQNRLRHSDYVGLFQAAGLEVLEENCHRANSGHLAELQSVPLADRFHRYDYEDLAVRSSHVVLMRR